MKPKVTVTTQYYFGDHFYYSGWALILCSIPFGIAKWYVGGIALLVGIIIVSTSYRLIIDQSNGKTEDFLFFLGLKTNRIVKPTGKLEYIMITSGRYTQQLQLRAASTVIAGTMYSAYLVTDNENLYLGESKNKKKLTRKVHNIAHQLGLELKDLCDQ